MVKYILVCAFASGMKMEISNSEHETIDDVGKELLKLDLDDGMISEILSGDTVCDSYVDDLCYWKLIEVNNVKT